MSRALICLSLLGLVAPSSPQAATDDLCAYKRVTAEDGEVWTFTNLGGGPHCKKRVKLQKEAGVYRANPGASRPARSGEPGRGASHGLPEKRLVFGEADGSYLAHIHQAAALYNLPEELLQAVMAVESNYNPLAVSQKGAAGLMQLMPGTALEMYVSDVWSVEQNIYGGARYLRVLANQYQGDMAKMLAAYNAGPEAVRKAGDKIPDIPETREYVRKVMALYERFKFKNGKG